MPDRAEAFDIMALDPCRLEYNRHVRRSKVTIPAKRQWNRRCPYSDKCPTSATCVVCLESCRSLRSCCFSRNATVCFWIVAWVHLLPNSRTGSSIVKWKSLYKYKFLTRIMKCEHYCFIRARWLITRREGAASCETVKTFFSFARLNGIIRMIL